jgi:pyruvate carboxylase
MYAAANDILGNIVKVTPSSKVVGDLALHLVAVGADPAEFADDPGRFDVPDSVVGFLSGDLGDPPGGWPEPFRTKVLRGRTVRTGVTPLGDADRAALAADSVTRRAALNRLLFPGPTSQFTELRELFGDLSILDTADYLYGLQPAAEHTVRIAKGVQLFVALEAIGEADGKGMRTVMTTLNGQLRPVFVRDRSITVTQRSAEKADPNRAGEIGAPFAGVVTVKVEQGQQVEPGQTIATIEAMKMEASITTPVAGSVTRLAVSGTAQVEAGDLLVVVA